MNNAGESAKRRMAAVVVLLLFLSAATAQKPAAKASLSDLAVLLGDWEGAGAGGPGVGTGEFSFHYDLQNQVMVRKNFADYPAANGRPAPRHDDLMVIYVDVAADQIRARYFDSEGHQINYLVTVSADRQTVTFVSDIIPAQPRFHLTYTKLKDGTLNGTFEIAPPGQPDGFKQYLAWSGRKK